MCWIDTYLKPPDLVTHDVGKNFINKEFEYYINTMGINKKEISVKAHNFIGIVK